MQDVQERLGELLRLPDGADAFAVLRRRHLERCNQPVVLRWEVNGHEEMLVHPLHRAKIRPDGSSMALIYTWPGRGSRIVARGDAGSLRARLAEIIRVGGPHGGAHVEDVEECRERVSRIILTSWEGPAPSDSAWTAWFGAGYEARVRPIADQHCLVVVSPRGSFILRHFGLHLGMASAARFYQGNDDVFADDFHSSSWPFHVRVRGVPHRLEHVPIPGLVGYARTEIGEVYLCLLGVNDTALVLVDGQGTRCLVREAPTLLDGMELCPKEMLKLPVTTPDLFDSDAVAAALGRIALLPAPIQAHLIALARAAVQDNGTREVRRFIWSVAALLEQGQRENMLSDGEELWRRMTAISGTRELPCGRTQRDALRWIQARSPILVQTREGRRVRWRLLFEQMNAPTQEFLAAIAESTSQLVRAAKAAARKGKRVKRPARSSTPGSGGV